MIPVLLAAVALLWIGKQKEDRAIRTKENKGGEKFNVTLDMQNPISTFTLKPRPEIINPNTNRLSVVGSNPAIDKLNSLLP